MEEIQNEFDDEDDNEDEKKNNNNNLNSSSLECETFYSTIPDHLMNPIDTTTTTEQILGMIPTPQNGPIKSRLIQHQHQQQQNFYTIDQYWSTFFAPIPGSGSGSGLIRFPPESFFQQTQTYCEQQYSIGLNILFYIRRFATQLLLQCQSYFITPNESIERALFSLPTKVTRFLHIEELTRIYYLIYSEFQQEENQWKQHYFQLFTNNLKSQLEKYFSLIMFFLNPEFISISSIFHWPEFRFHDLLIQSLNQISIHASDSYEITSWYIEQLITRLNLIYLNRYFKSSSSSQQQQQYQNLGQIHPILLPIQLQLQQLFHHNRIPTTYCKLFYDSRSSIEIRSIADLRFCIRCHQIGFRTQFSQDHICSSCCSSNVSVSVPENRSKIAIRRFLIEPLLYFPPIYWQESSSSDSKEITYYPTTTASSSSLIRFRFRCFPCMAIVYAEQALYFFHIIKRKNAKQNNKKLLSIWQNRKKKNIFSKQTRGKKLAYAKALRQTRSIKASESRMQRQRPR